MHAVTNSWPCKLTKTCILSSLFLIAVIAGQALNHTDFVQAVKALGRLLSSGEARQSQLPCRIYLSCCSCSFDEKCQFLHYGSYYHHAISS